MKGLEKIGTLEPQNEVFHVHTKRCQHASDETEEQYIVLAMEMGAKKITFTDHGPFPKNPFGNRMGEEELPEYISELTNLKEKYQDQIQVEIGLEIEYLPMYDDYYRELSAQVELLILGQHFYQIDGNTFCFMLPKEELQKEAYGLSEAMVAGMETGLFSVAAHPDRIFRRSTEWEEDYNRLSKNIIRGAEKNGVILEQNLASIRRGVYYPEFWKLVPENIPTIIGTDAHSLKQLEYFQEFILR